jgi:hypothetical protein
MTGARAAWRMPTMTARRGLRYEMAAVLGIRCGVDVAPQYTGADVHDEQDVRLCAT